MPARAQKPDRYVYMVWIKGTRMVDGARFSGITEYDAKFAFATAFNMSVDNLEAKLLGAVE